MPEEQGLTNSPKTEMIAQVTESEVLTIRKIQDGDREIRRVKQ